MSNGGGYDFMSDDYVIVPEEPEYLPGDDNGLGCKGGDLVPMDAPVWRCPECGAEWFDDELDPVIIDDADC